MHFNLFFISLIAMSVEQGAFSPQPSQQPTRYYDLLNKFIFIRFSL